MTEGDILRDLPGQTVDGKYRVEHLLGRGGMGAVFRAVHLGTDRIVALEVIAPAMAGESIWTPLFAFVTKHGVRRADSLRLFLTAVHRFQDEGFPTWVLHLGSTGFSAILHQPSGRTS